jgi:hypothetical protein
MGMGDRRGRKAATDHKKLVSYAHIIKRVPEILELARIGMFWKALTL